MVDRREFLLAVTALPFIARLDSGVAEFDLKFSGCDDHWTIKLKNGDCIEVLFNGKPMRKGPLGKYVHRTSESQSELKFRVNSQNEIDIEYVCSAHGKPGLFP